MIRIFSGIIFSLFILASPASAQLCNDPSGFVKLQGTFALGDQLLLGPDCQSVKSGGAPAGSGAGNITYVESCGAVGNGVIDDAPSIRVCAAQVAAAGGGTVGFSCNKNYLLGSRYPGNPKSIIPQYNGVGYVGCGDSSVLTIAAGMNTATTEYAIFYPLDETATYTINNARFENFKIFNNGANNSCSNTCNYQNVNIGIRYGNNILVNNVTFANNPGSQDVSFGLNSGIVISNVIVKNSRSINPCDAVNTACNDHSAFYGVVSQFTLTGNQCWAFTSLTMPTCMELHGNGIVATGNSDFNFGKSVNIAAQLGHSVNGLVYSDNVSLFARKGLQIFAQDGQTVSNAVISNNVWYRPSVDPNSTVAYIDFDQAVLNDGSSDITFKNNIIDGTSFAAGTANVTPLLILGRAANVAIEGNTFRQNSGPCITAGTLASTTSISIKNNVMTDCGTTSVAAKRRGILVNSSAITSFTVSNNRIANVAASYMTTGIDITMNVSFGYIAPDNRIENVATGVTLSGTGFSPYTANGIAYTLGQGIPFTSTAALTDGQLVVGQTGAAPLPRTVSSDCTLAASGAFTCLNSNGIALNYGAISTATPTLSTSTGTFTAATAALRYQLRGKQAFFNIVVNITTNGTAAGNVSVNGLPFTFASDCTAGGRATLVSGKMLQSLGSATGNSLVIWNQDNTYPGASGERLVVNAVCETT